MDAKLVERYIQIRRLAEQGVGGEASNARAQQQKLERMYPGIAAEADARIFRESQHAAGSPPPQSAPSGPTAGGAAPYMPWSWSWQQVATQAAAWASEVIDQVVTRDAARQRASNYTYTSRILPSGNMQWAVRMPLDDFYHITAGLSPEQKAELAHQMGDQIAQRIYASLIEGE